MDRMNSHLHDAQFLQQKIKNVLLKEWDPIGIGDSPEAQDEYDAYIAFVYKLIIQRKPEHEIFDYLWWAETDCMGLIGDKQKTLAIVHKLCKLTRHK